MSGFKYRGPEHLINHVLPKITKLVLSNASKFHQSQDSRYSDISENWRKIYVILLKVKAKKHITEKEHKELKATSYITDFLDEIMVFFRSSTNRLILDAAKRRFAQKENQASMGTVTYDRRNHRLIKEKQPTLPTIYEDKDENERDSAALKKTRPYF
tara:strand:+ start:19476 stop:19946 length:471 start_codon:yes stop_codon:yes gene_type:complete